MKVRLSRPAQIDLEEIGDWIGEDNPLRAISFLDELERRCRTLARFPRRYPVVLSMEGVEIRKRSYRRYVILYRVKDETVFVERIVHSARDWMALVEAFLG